MSAGLDEFEKAALAAHNKYRAKHKASPLKWNADMAKDAMDWAEKLAETGKFAHASPQERKNDGENIYMFVGKPEIGGDEAVDAWYSEIKDYDFDNDRFAGNTGHFTQVVWKDTKELGMSFAMSDDGKIFVVARYRPAGNMMSQFEKNISPPS